MSLLSERQKDQIPSVHSAVWLRILLLPAHTISCRDCLAPFLIGRNTNELFNSLTRADACRLQNRILDVLSTMTGVRYSASLVLFCHPNTNAASINLTQMDRIKYSLQPETICYNNTKCELWQLREIVFQSACSPYNLFYLDDFMLYTFCIEYNIAKQFVTLLKHIWKLRVFLMLNFCTR
jgi:hypothetical protein